MKAIIAASAAVLLLTAACGPNDTVGRRMWGRSVEPRLSTMSHWHPCTRLPLSAGRAVFGARCAEEQVLSGGCDDPVATRNDADAMLLTKPQCSDAATARLEALSRSDATAMSDLAAAYYVRAQRKDDAADLLHAFNAARAAVAVKPSPAGAQFNYALILEALSLNDAAIDAWQRAATDEDGDWAAEARARRAALVRRTAAEQWAAVREQIDRATAAGDVLQTRRLIAQFPASAERHFEDDALTQWDAPKLRTFATALSQFFNDRYYEDVVSSPNPSGVREFLEARAAENRLDYPAAAAKYASAATLLHDAGNPLYLLARIGHAGQKGVNQAAVPEAVAELDAVAADARRYPSILARVNLNRLFTAQFLGDYVELFAAYDAANAFYRRVGDWEDAASADARVIAAMRVAGLKAAEWRQALIAVRAADRTANVKTRYLLIGSTAFAALDQGAPEAALMYQNLALRAARDYSPPVMLSALGHLAEIEIGLGRYADARRHLGEAESLPGVSANNQRLFAARLAAVEGDAALRIEPRLAVGPLTRAIAIADRSEYPTFRAALYAQRAEANRQLGRHDREENDRREALRLLHDEEQKLLRNRQEGSSDDFWISYFSRFDETYDLLIRQLIAKGAIDEAFRYADRVRAYEPLDLVLRSPNAPQQFRELAADPEHLDVAKLQAVIPGDTFLIEYRIFDDATYAWILGRNVFAGLWVPAKRSEVKRWTDALRNAAADSTSSVAFENGLVAPYDRLLKGPVDAIHRLPGGRHARIIIVPDRELRSMPFAALRDPDTKRFLIEDHAASISGSALLYAFSVLRDRQLASGGASALLIGDPAFDVNSTLAEGLHRLPLARAEVGEISGLYDRPDVLIGDAATPRQFMQLAGGAAVIHIAAHAVVNGDAPSQSYLLLRDVLTAETLMKEFRTSKTRLVVLGACSSAGGLPVGAEGIAPLVRPIIGAGVPGVIGALWNIDDATAYALLVSFHRHYRRGDDAAEALRQAQLELLRSTNPGLRQARLWAPFEAIGVASSPFRSIADMTKEKHRDELHSQDSVQWSDGFRAESERHRNDRRSARGRRHASPVRRQRASSAQTASHRPRRRLQRRLPDARH